jgi:hypothetical protein
LDKIQTLIAKPYEGGNLAGRDDEIWAQLKAGLTEQFPNPRREGCPGDAVVKAIAFRRLPLPHAQKWLDHFGQCSPCFQEFGAFQAEARHKWKWKLTFGIAAALILFVSVIVRLISASHKVVPSELLSRTSTPPAEQALPIAMTLNLSEPDTLRGGGRTEIEHLLRRRMALTVMMPPHISSGECDIQLVKDISDKVPLISVAGIVRQENGKPVLHVAPDLSGLAPATYIIRFRHHNADWQYAWLILD